MSWQVLAVNHMCVHQHLNLVVFQVAFLPLAAVLLGVGVAALADRLRCGRAVGPVLLAIGVATAAVTLAKTDARATAEPAEQARAAEAVVRHLASDGKAHPGGLAGHAERIGDVYRLHHTHRVEMGLTTMTDPPDRREPVLLVSGWVVDYEAAGRVPSARVVVVVDGKPVAARVVRYGLPHLDRLLDGRRVPAGFAAIIRTADLPPGSEVRVFAVSAADPQRVLELPLKRE